MKATNKIVGRLVAGCGLACCLTLELQAQTNLQFTSVNATVEGAIQLHWASQSNHLYEIDEADALIDTNTGSITWNKLYDGYPSQGTNTFVGDFGNYNIVPIILHPKNSPMRFYRVVDQGQDSLASDEPTVSIISPTNGATAFGELTINVVAATDQPVISGTQLYVDGQAMQAPDSVTNWSSDSTNFEMDTYSINSCEWANGTHTLFATAENESGYGDAMNAPPVMTGHSVSALVPISFSNLVTRISFSQPSFDPSSGQTQQVSAVFAANSDWTLQIKDVNDNVVRTMTGSGTSMQFNWDGNGDGGASLPNGIYFYYITAQTNGLAPQDLTGGDSSGSGSPPAPALTSDASQLWAVAPDSENVVPLAIYPPGFDTNGLIIFAASPSEVEALTASSSPSLESAVATDSGSGVIAPDFSGPSPQPAPKTPQRPPNNPVKGLAGTFAIAYQTFTGNGTNGFHLNAPANKPYFPPITIQNASGGTFEPLPQHKTEANNFVSEMQHWGWSKGFVKADDQLKLSA